MLTRGSDNLTWDTENRLVSNSAGGVSTFAYDGDGNRVKKLVPGEGGGTETNLYVNKYYEKPALSKAEGNSTTGDNTTYCYLGANSQL
jgi:YD repeat-containing protein